MDGNKIERKVVSGKTELPSEPEFPAKCLRSEDSLPQNSPPFNNQGTTQPNKITRGLKLKLSFRKDTSKSVKEKSTEAKMDEKKKGREAAEEKTELRLEPQSPAKCMESEDGSGGAKNSPPLHKQGENEPLSFTKGIKQMLSFRKNTPESFKEESSEVEKDEKKTEISEDNGQTELSSEQEILGKCLQSEGGNCLPTASLLLNNPGHNEPKSFSKSPEPRQSFRGSTLISVKEKTTKNAGISRESSKHLSMRVLKLIKNGNQANEDNHNIPKKNEEVEGEENILKEPLSVMQIHGLIQKKQLWEAFKNIRSLEIELLAEGEAKKYEDNSKEYTMRVTDVNLLYHSISKEFQQIVEKTLDLPCLEVKGLITEMVELIKEAEKIHAGGINMPVPLDPVKQQLGLARNWRKFWEGTVKESVKRRIHKVAIPLKEDNPSWLSVHLGFLKTVIREDLLTIKHWLQKFYPQDYNVCDTYLKAFHEALSLHLQSILEEEESYLETWQFHALLNWVTNIYYSEDLLGHPDLKPEMNTEDLPSLLTPDILDKLQNGYINSLKWETKSYLENILCLETKKWDSEEQPETLQSQYLSFLSFDIQTIIGEHVKASGSICRHLERAALEIMVEEVTDFIPCFGKAFLEWDKMKDCPWFSSLMVAYINNFHDLRTGLQTKFNVNCEEMENILAGLMRRYKEYFLNKLRLKTQPMFKKIPSHTWILYSGTPDSFITKILLVVEDFSKDLKNLKGPMSKDFLNEVHTYVVKQYITQTLKPRYRMRRIKREEVGNIMHHEATTINNTMQDLGSSADWLFPAIPFIASIIAEKKKQKIKDYIKDLCQHYPDIRKEHISAILALRRLGHKKRKSIADQMDGPSEELECGSDKRLFADIELRNTIRCF